MHNPTVTRQNFPEVVRASGIRLELLAVATGKSYSAVYRYMNGSRRPSDEWIGQCAAALAAHAAGRAAA